MAGTDVGAGERSRQEISASRLRELVHYDPVSGIFTRRAKRRKHPAGERSGYITASGYRCLKLDGKIYPAARLAYLYVFGRWPFPEIDHIDRNRSNDAIINLREATRRENACNTEKRRRNKYRGVQSLSSVRHRAYISAQGKKKIIGTFSTAEEAANAYDEAALDAFGAFAILNFGDR